MFSINTDAIEILAEQVYQQASALVTYADRMKTVPDSLGMQIAGRSDITDSIGIAEASIRSCGHQATLLAIALSQIITSYRDSENEIIAREHATASTRVKTNTSTEEGTTDYYLLAREILERGDIALLTSMKQIIPFINGIDGGTILKIGFYNHDDIINAIYRSDSKDGDFIDNISESFLNDPQNCKAVLRGIIDSVADDKKRIGKELSEVYRTGLEEEILKRFDEAYQLVEPFGSKADKNIAKVVKGIVLQCQDYEYNMQIIESLKSTVPAGSAFYRTLTEVQDEYQHNISDAILKIIGTDYAEVKAAVLYNEYDANRVWKVLVPEKEILDKVLNAANKVDTPVKAVQNVLFSEQTMESAVSSLKESYKILQHEYRTGSSEDIAEAIKNYEISLDMAKAAKTFQYQNMIDYYMSGDSVKKKNIDIVQTLHDEMAHAGLSVNKETRAYLYTAGGGGRSSGGGGNGSFGRGGIR